MERLGREKLRQFRQKRAKGQKMHLAKWEKAEDLGIWQTKPKTYREGKKLLIEKKPLLYNNNLVLKVLNWFLLKSLLESVCSLDNTEDQWCDLKC